MNKTGELWITDFNVTFKAEQQGQLLREAISRFGISKRALTAIKFEGGQIIVNGRSKMYVMLFK